MATDAVQLIERSLSDYNREGVEALLPHVHPEFSMTTTAEVASEPDTYAGHDGLRRYFESFMEAMESVKLEPLGMEQRGDAVRITFDIVAVGRATGIEVTQRGFGIWEIDGDLVRGIRFFPNEEEQAGAWAEYPD